VGERGRELKRKFVMFIFFYLKEDHPHNKKRRAEKKGEEEGPRK